VCKVLVGNKCDKNERLVSFDEGQKLAKEFGMQFFETSAKTNINVSETFTFLTKEILKNNETNGNQNIVIDKPGGGKNTKKNVIKLLSLYLIFNFYYNFFIL